MERMTSEQRRIKYRAGLSSLYMPVYDALCEQMPGSWAPYYGLRSLEEQDALYTIGRTRMGRDASPAHPMGRVITNAQAGESPHNYGCATDWVLWDESGHPMWIESNDPRWVVYSEACQKVGAKWGGEFHSVDCPHNELNISAGWKSVFHELKTHGTIGAKSLIENLMVRR